MNPDYQKLYNWKLSCVNGEAWQSESLGLNHAVAEYGIPYKIELISALKRLPNLTVDLPIDSDPVYFRRVHKAGGELQSVKFFIGWELNDVKNMISVDSETGEVRLEWE